MNDADRLGMLTWSRITRISSSRSNPLRRTPMFTNVPFGPLSLLTVASVVQPLVLAPSTVGDHVAAADAVAERRRAFEHAHRGDVAVDRLNGEAEAVVAAFLPLAHLRVGPRVHEARMRIERLQHAVDGAVDHAVGFDRLGVLRLDGGQRRGEGLVVIRHRVGGGERALAVNPANEGGNHDGDNGGDGRSAAHRSMVTDYPLPDKDGGTGLGR